MDNMRFSFSDLVNPEPKVDFVAYIKGLKQFIAKQAEIETKTIQLTDKQL